MNKLTSLLVFASTAGVVFAAPRVAHAGLEACNNISVSADAHCEVAVQGGCDIQCMPIHFAAACSARLETTCDGQCNVDVDATCSASCETDCEAKCNVDPPKLDCNADCDARCTGDCQAQCSGEASGSEAEAHCQASCKTCCSGHCDASCTSKPATADCTTKCQGSCQGSCKGRANIDCQVKCQSTGYASCETELTGGCKTQCQKPSGALFCDGDFVDTGDNLQNCVDALNAYLHIKVQASGSASCTGNECQAEGKASASSSCAAAPGDAPLSGAGLFAGLAFAGAAISRRRRR